MSRRVLLTGAGGFIGRHAAAALASQKLEVHAVSSRHSPPEIPGVRWHRTDLLDAAATEQLLAEVRPHQLMHLAWVTTPGLYRESPENLTWTAATVRLLEDFAQNGGERAVMAGSVFEYDWAGGICHELRTPRRPSTLYGACKSALGEIVTAAGPGLGISCAWGRVFWLYGPHEPAGRLVSDLIAGLLAGRAVTVGPGYQQRDYLHVADVAGALAALLCSDATGPVNIASGDSVTVRSIYEQIGSRLGRSELISVQAGAGAGEAALVVADVTRLRDEVGFRPAFDLDDGLRDTVNWWRWLNGGRAGTAGTTRASA